MKPVVSNKYYLLSINDFQNNHNTTFISAFKYQTLTDNNILCKIINAYKWNYTLISTQIAQ